MKKIKIPKLKGGPPPEVVEMLKNGGLKNMSGEDKIKMFMMNMPAIMVAIDKDNKIAAWNRAAASCTGFSSEEIKDASGETKKQLDKMRKMIAKRDLTYMKPYSWEMNFTSKEGKEVELSGHNIAQFFPVEGWKSWAIIKDVTELNKISRDLQISEQKYRTIFENSQMGIFHTSLDGKKMLEVNDTFTRIFGLSKKELLEEADMLSWFDPSKRGVIFTQLLKTGRVSNVEIEATTKTKGKITVLFSATVYPLKKYIEGSTVDITHLKQIEKDLRLQQNQIEHIVKKRTEELGRSNEKLSEEVIEKRKVQKALELSEKNYRTLFNNAPIGLFRMDAKTNRMIEVNQQFAKTIGLEDSSKALEMNVFSNEIIVNEDDRKRMSVNFQLTGVVEDFETQIQCFDGTHSWVRISVYLNQEDGFIEGVIADINETKIAEKQLEERDEQLLAFFDSAPMIMGISELVDDNLRNVSSNPQLAAAFRISQNTENRFFHELGMPQEIHDLWLGHYKESLSRKQSVKFEYKTIFGEYVSWYSATISYIDNPDAQHPRFSYIIEDITQRKKSENTLIEYTQKLENSNRDLQEFAYIASHDLQEPLRKIIAFSDRIMTKYNDTLDETGKDYMTRMQNATIRMQDLINDLLTLSRVATHTNPFTPTKLEDIIHDVIDVLEMQIKESNGVIEIEELPEIEVDPFQIRQLFQNLIGNGLKFHREDVPPLIRIYAKGKNKNNHCQIVIEDNGVGFDPKYIDRIFKPFQRLHGRSEYDGTGMGLAICRRIVERHNGEIIADSIPGEGSAFTITLPPYQIIGEKND